MHRRRIHRTARTVAALAAALVVAASAGCNIIVPVAYIIEGPPTVDAQFKLPANRRTVVFVDDTRNYLPRTALRTRIGDRISTLLLEQGVITEAISSADALQMARRYDTDSKRLSIGQIGEEVGAETLIYVKIDEFMLTPDGATPRPAAGASVKVLDIAGSTRLFPSQGDDGAKVVAQLREQQPDNYRSSAGRRQMEDALADELGRKVAGLFFKHEDRELGGRLGVR